MNPTQSDPAAAASTIARLEPAAIQALQTAEQAINAVASRKSSGKDGKAAAKKIFSGARQVLPILTVISEVHPIAKGVIGIFAALVEMEANRQNNNLQIAVVYHSMTITMHTLRYLGALLDQVDEVADEIQDTLNEMTRTMEEFGNLVNTYYRYSAKHAIFRILRSQEYKEQLDDINQTFSRLKDDIRMILEARTMVSTFDTHEQVQTVSANINTVIQMLGAIGAKEQKAEEYSKAHGGAGNIIQDDVLLAKVAEILGEKLPPQIKAALRKDMQDILEHDRTQFKFALQAASDHIEESVARSEMAIIRHLDAGPHELLDDPDMKALWQEMKWRTSVKVRPFVDALHEYFQRQYAMKKQETGSAPDDAWTLKYLAKVMYHPAIGNAIDEDGSGFVSVHELNHFIERRPVKSWTVPETLVFWAVVWPQSNAFYYADIAHCLKTIRTLINRRKVADSFKDYLEVLGYLDVVVESLDDVEDEDGDGLTALLDEYVEAKDAEIMTFLTETQFRISDTSTLEFIVGQRIELVLAPLLGHILMEHMKVIQGLPKGQPLDDETIGSMCETCASIFVAFYERFEELQRGWKQQKVDVHLYTDSFANGLFTAIYKADENGFSQLTGDVDEYDEELSDEEEEDDESSEATAADDKTDQLLKMVSDLVAKMSGMEARLANMEKMLGGGGQQKARSGPNVNVAKAGKPMSGGMFKRGKVRDDDGDDDDDEAGVYNNGKPGKYDDDDDDGDDDKDEDDDADEDADGNDTEGDNDGRRRNDDDDDDDY
ncbi:EF-hand domain-containing protein [Pleurotus pulmonarius]